MRPEVSLRLLTVDDKLTVREWRNRRDVAKYMYRDTPISLEEHEIWFERILVDKGVRYWIIQVDSIDVGVACITGISNIHSHADWAFYIAAPDSLLLIKECLKHSFFNSIFVRNANSSGSNLLTTDIPSSINAFAFAS